MNIYLHLLRDIFTKNIILKMVSLLAGFLLWAVISTEPETTRTFRVPLEYQNFQSKNYELTGDSIDSVEVRFTGPSNWLRRIEPGDLSVTIDLTNWRPGPMTVQITKDKINLHEYAQKGISIESIKPTILHLQFEKKMSRDVEIAPNIVGLSEIAPGYIVQSIQWDPRFTKIQGPESSMTRINKIMTEIIDVRGANSSMERKMHLFCDDARIELDYDLTVDVKIVVVPQATPPSKDKK